jgi:predicted dehydrogenase
MSDAVIRVIKDDDTTLTVPGVDQYRLMVEHFAEAVLDGVPLKLPPEDAVANLRVIEAAQRSVRSSAAEAVA